MKKYLFLALLFSCILQASDTDLTAFVDHNSDEEEFLAQVAAASRSSNGSPTGYQSLGDGSDEEGENGQQDEVPTLDPESQRVEEDETPIRTIKDAFASSSSCLNVLKFCRNLCCFGDCIGEKSPEMNLDSCCVKSCFECCDKEVCCQSSRCMFGTVCCIVGTGVLGTAGMATVLTLVANGIIQLSS